jgi:hypothetical protein
VGDAVGEAGGDELEPGLFEGSGGSADLGDDVFALAAVVKHAFDAGELAADAVEASADVGDDVVGDLHDKLIVYPGGYS